MTAVLTADASPVKIIITSFEWLVPLSGRSVFISSTPADFNAISAITIPIGAGDAHTKPNGLPIGTSNALLIASPHLALYWNSI